MMWSYGEDVLKTEWILYNHTQRKDEVFAVLVGWLCGFLKFCKELNTSHNDFLKILD